MAIEAKNRMVCRDCGAKVILVVKDIVKRTRVYSIVGVGGLLREDPAAEETTTIETYQQVSKCIKCGRLDEVAIDGNKIMYKYLVDSTKGNLFQEQFDPVIVEALPFLYREGTSFGVDTDVMIGFIEDLVELGFEVSVKLENRKADYSNTLIIEYNGMDDVFDLITDLFLELRDEYGDPTISKLEEGKISATW